MLTQKTGYWLTKIRLHHWHGYHDQEIDIPLDKHGLHLTGDRGAGKSTIIDGIMWALTGSERLARFNQAATLDGKRSLRNLLGYVRGEVKGEYIRDSGTAHVLLEFTHAKTRKYLTVGSLIDYDESTTDSIFIIAEKPLAFELIATREKQPYDVSQFKKFAKRLNSEIKVYSSAKEYRETLSQYFGNLPSEFFERIGRLSGQQNFSPSNVADIFNVEEIKIDQLRDHIDDLHKTEIELNQTKQRLKDLDDIYNESDRWKDAQKQLELYEIYRWQEQLEETKQLLQQKELEYSSTEIFISDKSNELQEANIKRDDAKRVWLDWIDRRHRNTQIEELKRLMGLLKSVKSDLLTVTQKLKDSQESVASMEKWFLDLPKTIDNLLTDTELELPNQELLKLPQNIQLITLQTQIQQLSEWVAIAKSQLEEKQKEVNQAIFQTKIDVEAIKAGEIPNEKAYKVKDILRQHGTIDILCNLIADIDIQWQPIIERLLGSRRFTLITTDDNYTACLAIFRDLPSEKADGVHLARPKDAQQHQHVVQGSLAEKVTAKNQIAQGLLNLHLNKLQANKNDNDAIESRNPTATPTGLVVRGGTIQRLKPYSREHLVFDSEAMSYKRKALEDKLTQLQDSLKTIRVKLTGMISLYRDITSKFTLIGQIDLSLAEQKEQLQSELMGLEKRIKELELATNFIELEEQINKTSLNYEALAKKCTLLEAEIEHYKRHLTSLKTICDDFRAKSEDIEEKLKKYLHVTWQESYEKVKAGCTELNFKQFLERVYGDWVKKSEDYKRKLDDKIRIYFDTQNIFLPLAFEKKLETCLEEREHLRTHDFDSLTKKHEVLRIRAEQTLKITFFDALLKEHGIIDLQIKELNKSIENVRMGRSYYKFKHELIATDLVRQVWNMVQEYSNLKPEKQAIDLTNQVFERHKDLIEDLLALFKKSDDKLNIQESQQRKLILSPLKYFYFDMYETEDKKKWTALSKSYGKDSGGERQDPLFILLAAVMMQLYEKDSDRPRLVIVDEAFGKAPLSAGKGLQLLIDEGLQPIVSSVLNMPQIEEVIGYTQHLIRLPNDIQKGKNLVYLITTDQKEKLFSS